MCCPHYTQVVPEVFGFIVPRAIFKSSKYIVDMRSQYRWHCGEFFSITYSGGPREQRDWRAEFQRTVCLAKGACQIDLVFVGSVAIDLESPINGVCAKLSVTTG